MTQQTEKIYEHALEVLKENDQGSYTIPTKGLYPFQWNWDSCLTALGQFHYDEARAWTEIETLFANQWPDGMVPHIVFHVYSDGYFPGPNVWDTGRPTPTSGITQPPVAGFAIKRLYDRATDKAEAAKRARALLPRIDAWHRWFYDMRDPGHEGLVAILHPWESGRDNSIDWDEAFERVPTDGVEPYVRRDTQHADPAHRPTKAQYDRYLYLVQLFRSLGWDNARLHDASPFKVVDPGFNAILIRSATDLAALADELGEPEIAARNRARAEAGLAALETLWSEPHGQYLCRDRVTGQLIDSASIGGILPVFAAVPKAR
ncbi:trehalase family glycosidase, partial [Devosia sp. 66-14]